MVLMTGITNKQVSEVLPEDVRSANLGNLALEEREVVATGNCEESNDGVHPEESTSSALPPATAEAAEEGAVSSSKRIKTADSSPSDPAPTCAFQANFRVSAPARTPAAAPQSPLLHTLPPVPEMPYSAAAASAMWRERAPSPAPSTASSSAFSAATTSVSCMSSLKSSSSSRASLSSSRSRTSGTSDGTHGTYGRRGKGARGSSGRLYPGSSGRVSASAGGGSGAGFFPPPPSWWGRGGASEGGSWRRGRRERGLGRESGREREREIELERRRERREKECRRWPRKDYASEAGVAHDGGGSCSSGGGKGGRYSCRKRSRSCSRERGSRATRTAGEVKCERCLEWCRVSRERKLIPRTLPMDYWVRTAGCKQAKSRHIDYIDNATYSREQFIEETVFTCPSTGARRDIVLERNMFPYDVPTDVEHWTLWSRHDLTDAGMQEFVQKWAASNHPHVVEWECDNNEGDRSIDWFHVHVFFRLGCEDRTGLPRDPASVYDGPCRKQTSEGASEAGITDGEESAVTDCE